MHEQLKGFQSDYPGIMKALIDANVNVSARHSGAAPLAIAVSKRNAEAVDILLAAGANPNDVNWAGFSVLMIACRHRSEVPIPQQVHIVKALIAAGADVNLISKRQTPLDVAVTPDIASVLVEAGGKMWRDLMAEKYELVHAVDGEEFDLELFDELLVNAGEEEKEIALILCALDKCVTLVKRLLAAGVSTEIEYGGDTLLLVVSTMGYVDIVRELLDAGADITAKDVCGKTPMQCAAGRKHRDVVALLLSKAKELKNVNKQ
jgi:ankyrin repeat protein